MACPPFSPPFTSELCFNSRAAAAVTFVINSSISERGEQRIASTVFAVCRMTANTPVFNADAAGSTTESAKQFPPLCPAKGKSGSIDVFRRPYLRVVALAGGILFDSDKTCRSGVSVQLIKPESDRHPKSLHSRDELSNMSNHDFGGRATAATLGSVKFQCVSLAFGTFERDGRRIRCDAGNSPKENQYRHMKVRGVSPRFYSRK